MSMEPKRAWTPDIPGVEACGIDANCGWEATIGTVQTKRLLKRSCAAVEDLDVQIASRNTQIVDHKARADEQDAIIAAFSEERLERQIKCERWICNYMPDVFQIEHSCEKMVGAQLQIAKVNWAAACLTAVDYDVIERVIEQYSFGFSGRGQRLKSK